MNLSKVPRHKFFQHEKKNPNKTEEKTQTEELEVAE